ncbi:TPA: D-glycero-beta-D-manno-heptose 1,7-bisphosphate 7-phosphatase [Legionella feeleii]|uniref:D,D-heptose 1,7-bisphosphate phosphatase n=1 Tax=Legionella feeleii TaxID=453 RepID=A0A0W0U3J7_9GAMM|nr:D-glycero-beta-D-manno-heptose 1,7-bisphosphate 7-phosphatase [Legionella feeleii]KTD02628.1 D,D-heptose 1,7-bisphosphate phosphatase [Legionella feeleii]SPX61179.1 D,D-heptose 1,7-bisphosphate phosphatase [Legionella feeleii]STX37740.1 D,D-heptose 1,7-bisphosphate phosphatase [Legionella feeleii]
MNRLLSKVVLLDRDGVINQDSLHYIKSVDEFIFLPGSVEAIAALTKAGYRIGVATNQSGVSRGYYNEEALAAIHEKLLQHVRAAGGEIEAIEYCIHMPDQGCFCRKPNPGMLYALARKLECTLINTPFIGDRVSDIQAAEAVGAKPLLVFSPMTDRIALQAYSHVPVFNSLAQCVEQLLAP